MELKEIEKLEGMSNQELLDYLLTSEMKELKEKIFPNNERSLLMLSVEIIQGDLSEKNWKGMYSPIKKDETDILVDRHKITIDIEQIASEQDQDSIFAKEIYYEDLMQVVRHELIHAFVKEYYQPITSVKNIHDDSSHVFLGLLWWVDGRPSMSHCKYVIDSGIADDVENKETFVELDKYLKNVIKKYEKESEDIAKDDR